jgi:hypothetical protein
MPAHTNILRSGIKTTYINICHQIRPIMKYPLFLISVKLANFVIYFLERKIVTQSHKALSSVTDSDPNLDLDPLYHVFGSPGSDSISQR